MATPNVVNAGGYAPETLVKAWYSIDTTINFTTDITFTGDTKSTDTLGVFSTSTGRWTIPAGKAGLWLFQAFIVLSNSNLGEGNNNIYASGSIGGSTYTLWGPRMANDNYWTNNFNYHMSVCLPMAVGDTMAFVIAQHNSGGNHVFRAGSAASNFVQGVKIG